MPLCAHFAYGIGLHNNYGINDPGPRLDRHTAIDRKYSCTCLIGTALIIDSTQCYLSRSWVCP